MATEIVVPEVGESIVEATVARWLKREGERVVAGEPVVELETEKANVEVPAPRSGVLTRIVRREGEDVRIGDVLGVVEEAAVEAEQPPAAPEAVREAEAAAEEAPKATPLARRLAEEAGIDLSKVPATGPGGRITREDVLAYIERQRAAAQVKAPAARPTGPEAVSPEAAPAGPRVEPAPVRPDTRPSPPRPEVWTPPPPPPTARPEAGPQPREVRVRMSRRRQTIARRMLEATQTTAMLTTFNEVDMGAVMEIRRRYREMFMQKYGVSLGIMPFFVKATVAALKAFPKLNAEIQGDEIVYKNYYDIGIAVGASEGLVVPVLRDADKLSFAEIEQKIADFARRAEENKLTLEELQGGTFTITNGGVFGSLLSTPILNPPQVGILGLHRIIDRPVVVNGQVVIRPMMYVALTYDHRLVDGREAVQFLVRVKQLIEDPALLLVEGW
jgi:2-oxoglutarate dehydrogenase E2 component (dihydrolipoamide succinyltransferase)